MGHLALSQSIDNEIGTQNKQSSGYWSRLSAQGSSKLNWSVVYGDLFGILKRYDEDECRIVVSSASLPLHSNLYPVHALRYHM